jgi:hypothetical protein
MRRLCLSDGNDGASDCTTPKFFLYLSSTIHHTFDQTATIFNMPLEVAITTPPTVNDVDHDDDQDEEDTAPLVADSRILSPLEIRMDDESDEAPIHRQRRLLLLQEQQPLSYADTMVWWVIRTLLLVVVALIPLAIGRAFFVQSDHHEHGIPIVTWEQEYDTTKPTTMAPTSSLLEQQQQQESHNSTQVLDVERDPVSDGCEPEHSFDELLKKMEEMEPFSRELCGGELAPDKVGFVKLIHSSFLSKGQKGGRMNECMNI